MNIVQGNTLTYKNSKNRLIKFTKWIPYGDKVKRSIFTFKSLFNNGDIDDVDANEGQLSLFDSFKDNDSTNKRPMQITKVYEEVKNG